MIVSARLADLLSESSFEVIDFWNVMTLFEIYELLNKRW